MRVGSSAGNNHLVVTNAGKVGIGATSPNEKLSVDTGSNGSAGYISVDSQALTRLKLGYSFTSSPSAITAAQIYADSSGNLDISSRGNAASAIQLYTSSGTSPSERMRIASDGNVGIGTTNPGAKLDISDSIPILRITGTRNASWTIGQTMASLEYFSEDASGTAANSVRASINLVNEASVYGSTTGLSFSTKGDTAGLPTEKMRIDSSGNVGIGTTNPSKRLHVSSSDQSTARIRLSNTNTSSGGDNIDLVAGINNVGQDGFSIYNATSNQTQLVIQGGGNVGIGTSSPDSKLEVEGNIRLSKSNDLTNGFELGRDGSTLDAFILQRENADLFFRTNNIERMRIDSSGKVGIGTTGPAQKLTINSGRMLVTNSTTPIYIKVNSSYKSWVHHISSDDGYIFAPSTADGGETWDWANSTKLGANGVVTAKNFVLSSDERFKDNVKDIKDNEIKVAFKSFEIKSSPGEKRYGVIAQELEKNNPELVTTDTEGFKSVKYIDLLIAKIAELENRIQTLENK